MKAATVIVNTPAPKEKVFFSKAQRKKIVREYKSGTPVTELMKKYGVPSNSSIYTWASRKKRSRVSEDEIAKPIIIKQETQSRNGDLAKENQLLRNIIIDFIIGKLRM